MNASKTLMINCWLSLIFSPVWKHRCIPYYIMYCMIHIGYDMIMLGPHVLTFVWLCAEAEDFVPSPSNYCTSNLQTHDNAYRIFCASLGRRMVWNVSVFTASLSQSLPKVSLVISCDMWCFVRIADDYWVLFRCQVCKRCARFGSRSEFVSRSLWLAFIILYD